MRNYTVKVTRALARRPKMLRIRGIESRELKFEVLRKLQGIDDGVGGGRFEVIDALTKSVVESGEFEEWGYFNSGWAKFEDGRKIINMIDLR